MKRLILASLMLTGCGQDNSNKPYTRIGPIGPIGPVGPMGPAGKDGTNGKDFTPAAEVSLSGYHMLPSGGYIEFIEDSDDKILINGVQRIYSTNTDGTIGLFLSLVVGPYTPHSNIIRTEYIATYVGVTNNIHVLATNVQIVGARKTIATFSRNTSGKLVINMKIYSATGLTIEADRTVTAE